MKLMDRLMDGCHIYTFFAAPNVISVQMSVLMTVYEHVLTPSLLVCSQIPGKAVIGGEHL